MARSWIPVYRTGGVSGYYWTPHRAVAVAYGTGEPHVHIQFAPRHAITMGPRRGDPDAAAGFAEILGALGIQATARAVTLAIPGVMRYIEPGDGFVSLLKAPPGPVPEVRVWLPSPNPRAFQTTKSQTAELIATPGSLRIWPRGEALVAAAGGCRRACDSLRIVLGGIRRAAADLRTVAAAPCGGARIRIIAHGSVPGIDIVRAVAFRSGGVFGADALPASASWNGGRPDHEARSYRSRRDGQRKLVPLLPPCSPAEGWAPQPLRLEVWYPDGCLQVWSEEIPTAPRVAVVRRAPWP